MATTPGGQQIADHSTSRLVLPSGGITDPKRSANGQVTVEDGKLYVFFGGKWFSVAMTEVPIAEPAADSDLNVLGAGSAACNGTYNNVDADNWEKASGVFSIKRIQDYPVPGQPALAICQAANVYYTAPDVPNPWDAVWNKASFGSDPAPTVEPVFSVVPAQKKAPAKTAPPPTKQVEAKK